MADEKNTPAGQTDFNKITKDYRQARKTQEILQQSIVQYAQEGQQAQEILINDVDDCAFDTETQAILINGEKIPQLDPESPQFDPALYNSYAAAINERLKATMAELATEIEQGAAALINTEVMQSLIATMNDIVAPVLENIVKAVNTFVESDVYKGIADLGRYILEHNEELQQRVKEWEQLQPYLEEEIKKPQYGGKTIEELLNEDYKDENGEIIEYGLFEQAIEAAKAAMLANALPVIFSNSKIDKVDYPLDKINANVWTLLKDADKSGQLTFAMERRGSKKQANVTYSIDFDALQQEAGITITKNLTAFDKRLYLAAGALINNGIEIATPAQLYIAMGNTGRPSANDIKKINDEITKMNAAHIYLDNEHEHQVYDKMVKFVYDGSLLPMERISAVVNGQTVDNAIHFFREPPLITFARERKQITTVSRHLLESPLSKTDANLIIDDYLIERISRIKNDKHKTTNRLLYATIYEKCNITTKMQRSRAKEKITKYLDHYKECKFIKGYKEDAEGITIIY